MIPVARGAIPVARDVNCVAHKGGNLLLSGTVNTVIIIPFALVGYEIGNSQLSAMRLVGHLVSNVGSWNNNCN